MTNLLEMIFGKKIRKTSLEAIIAQTVESLSYAYKVDQGTVRSIILDWMRFEKDVRNDIYE